MSADKHVCPACGCHLGQYALVGAHGPRFELEGLVKKVLRLSAELRKCKQQRG